MKSIRQKILYLTIAPFFLVYSALSVFIVYQVYKIHVKETGRQLQNIALYNEVNLRKCCETVELAVQVCASELEKIDSEEPAARMTGEHIITSRFQNPYVINTWVIFEPNAFDGKDELHKEDYPGAPSGRYIRSFIRDGDSWIVLDDIEETDLDDRDKSYYYIIPMTTGAFFTDFGSHKLLWDYGSGPASSFGVVMPVFRNGRIIGCVGLDAAINEKTLGEVIYPNSVSAIFLSDGRLGYSSNVENIGKTLEELNFGNSDEITDRLKNNKEYLYMGYSGFSGAKCFNYFFPVEIFGGYVYIYTSIPQRDILLNMILVLLPIGSSFFISLIVFILLFIYLSRGIAVPLKKLTEACESIVQGSLEMNINVVNSDDELGMISRSLLGMTEQFKTSKFLQERYYDRFDIIMKIHYALFRSDTLGTAFSSVLNEIAGYFCADKASFVFIIRENPTIVAIYPPAERDEGDSEFFAHNQVVKLLEGKKHYTINGSALESSRFPFVDFNTGSLCMVPLRVNDVLEGYIIMEGKKKEPLVNDDTTLLFLGDALSYIISFRAGREQIKDIPFEQPGEFALKKMQKDSQELFLTENEDDFLNKAKSIQNLNIDKGILLIGGEKKKYTELLKITVKVVSESILKMRSFYANDLAAFAIEVHGLKAALYSIGAEVLGDEARQLEFAAKSEDAEYCTKNYPILEEKLRVFSRNLAALFPHKERNFRKGELKELEDALVQAKQACENFDIYTANSLLEPLVFQTWDIEIIQKSLQNIMLDIENLEYEGISGKIIQLLSAIRNRE